MPIITIATSTSAATSSTAATSFIVALYSSAFDAVCVTVLTYSVISGLAAVVY